MTANGPPFTRADPSSECQQTASSMVAKPATSSKLNLLDFDPIAFLCVPDFDYLPTMPDEDKHLSFDDPMALKAKAQADRIHSR